MNRSRVQESDAARRGLAALQVAIGAACLWSQLRPAAPGPWIVTLMAGLFTCHGLALAIFPRYRRVGFDLLALVCETAFFLVFAFFGAGGFVWLSCALFFHLLVATMILHQWWDTWVVAASSIGFVAVVRGNQTEELLPIVFWTGLVAAVGALSKSKIETRFLDSVRQVREFREQADNARDAERHKIAGDFHDGPLQGFISLQMRLEVLRKVMERDAGGAEQELRSLQELTRSQIAEMRAFLRGIRPVEVGEAGLAASLRQAAAEFQKHSGIATAFESSGALALESAEASQEVVQILREGLTNIQKHSRATHVAVTVHGRRNQLEIAIEDNGIGFPFSGAYQLEELELLHTGPSSIERRVRMLGGKLLLESRPQRGSAITVWIPA